MPTTAAKIAQRDGQIHGRHRSVRHHNVVVYTEWVPFGKTGERAGWAAVEIWNANGDRSPGRRGRLRFTLEELRVLQTAINSYLAPQRSKKSVRSKHVA